MGSNWHKLGKNCLQSVKMIGNNDPSSLTHIIHTENLSSREITLGLFVEKLQPKVSLAGYDILFAYFIVEAKSKNKISIANNFKIDDFLLILSQKFLWSHAKYAIKLLMAIQDPIFLAFWKYFFLFLMFLLMHIFMAIFSVLLNILNDVYYLYFLISSHLFMKGSWKV